MAHSTLCSNEILLFDNSPGPTHWGALPPADPDGNHFISNSHANASATGSYEPGYKVGYFDNTNQGPSILAYMKYSAGDVTLAAGHICSIDTSISTVATWTSITNDGDDGILSPAAYIALEAVTDTYWAWFWCGGVAPSDHIAAFVSGDTVIDTDTNIADESLLEMVDGSTPDIIVFKPAATTYQACGLSFAQDDG